MILRLISDLMIFSYLLSFEFQIKSIKIYLLLDIKNNKTVVLCKYNVQCNVLFKYNEYA